MHFVCEFRESIPGTRGRPHAPFPPLGTRFRGHDDAPTAIPAKLVLVETGSRNPSLGRGGAPRPIPLSGYPLSRARRRPQPPFLRSLSSWKRGAGIHPWGAGEAPPHPPRCPTVIPAKAGIHPWDAGEAPPHLPPLGTRFRGHDDAPTVIPAEAGIHPWGAGEAPPYSPPLGTRFRGHDGAPTVIPAKAGIHPWRAGERPPHPPSGCQPSLAWLWAGRAAGPSPR